jgi:hypothetical protein
VEQSSVLGKGTVQRRLGYAAILAMILPNLIWIFLDRGLWVSDTAHYGFLTLELYRLLDSGPGSWIQGAMAIGSKPPILPWAGQFLVPVGELVGNIDAGLLMLTFLSQAVALLFLFETLIEYGKNGWNAIAGCAGAASAPLFVDVSKQYYVQPLQFAAVCWFLYIMARSRTWDALSTVLQLTAATSFAMLATMSSPAFCLVPGAVALYRALRKLPTGRTKLDRRHAWHFALAGPLALSALSWYRRNLSDAIDYGTFSFNYVYGGLLGADYLEKFRTWTSFLLQFGLITPVALLLFLGSVIFRVRTLGGRRQSAGIPLLVAVTQIPLAVGILALSEHQTSRYPLPILAYVVVIVGVSLTMLGKPWLTTLVLGAFLVQLGFVNLVAFGCLERPLWDHRPIQIAPGREVELVEAISGVAAPGDGDVVLVTSALRIYSSQVKYHVAKKSQVFTGASPGYMSAEFVLTQPDVAADVDRAWEQIAAEKPAYFVVPSYALRRSQLEEWRAERYGWSAIMRGAIEISERVVADGSYRRQPLPGYPEIEVYTRRIGE